MGSPELRVRFQPSGQEARVAPGTTLLAAAHWAGTTVDSTCGGYGTCGLCRLRVLEGDVPASPEDSQHISRDELADGWRLACRAELEGDTVCQVPAPAEHPRSVVEGIQRAIAVEPRVRIEELESGGEGGDAKAIVCGSWQIDVIANDRVPQPFGVALDLGTSTVAGALVDLVDGTIVAAASIVNGQVAAGADVISRAAYARSRPGGALELQGMAVDTMNQLVARLGVAASVFPGNVYECVVAGNSIMLHLLLGVDPYPLSVAPFETVFDEPLDVAAADLRVDTVAKDRRGPQLAIHPQARLQSFPMIGAYAGGDTVAGLHATDIVRGDRPRLLIDLGTNTEVALGYDGRVVVASAPAGPAFEGGGVRCGMAAVEGAVARVKLGPAIELEVIGGGAPRGLCGSGLVDAVAELRWAGLLDRSGRLGSAEELTGNPLADRLEEIEGARAFRLAEGIYIGQRDIRELQSAIAAVAAAVRIVLGHEKVEPHELADVYLAGSFGAALDPRSARSLGLVPPVSENAVRGVGNAAIEGAKAALLSFREREVAFQIPFHTEYLELSGHPDFNDTFMAAMTFPDLEGLG
ncbi:MAG: DUF4445 domain-containing protein [Gemmatimonadota bacterium]|nr:MAG: DUF4445 domain-containing protein [Gemmatimonadota bacterium]